MCGTRARKCLRPGKVSERTGPLIITHAAEAALALAGSQTQMSTGALDSYAPMHKQKRLRVLAVSGPQRDESHHEFPTLAELGYDIKIDQMTGLFAPPKLLRVWKPCSNKPNNGTRRA